MRETRVLVQIEYKADIIHRLISDSSSPLCTRAHCDWLYFPNDENYQRHVKQSRDHPECAICHQKFDHRPGYEEHVKRSHPQFEYCGQCNIYFACRLALDEHCRDSGRHQRCDLCKFGFRTVEEYDDHCAAVHEYEESCDLCRIKFKDDAALQEHYLHSPNHPVCTICNLGLFSHGAHTLRNSDTHSTLYCDPCGCTFENEIAAEEHLLNSPVHDAYQCAHCDAPEIFSSDGYQLHVETCHSDIFCEICKRTFRNIEEIKNHYLTSPIHTAYQCSHCNSAELFQSDTDFETHIATVHSSIICEPCKRTFRDTEEIENHYLTSPIHTAYQCSHCNSAELFQSDTDFETHISTVHSSIICEPCKRTFRDTEEIENHYLTSPIHIAYRCTQCKTPELFQSDEDLETHITNAHSNTMCKECNRKFRSAKELQKHYLDSPVHIAYQCTLCKTAELFQSDEDLETHITTVHLNTFCKPCKRTFGDEDEIEHHLLNCPVHTTYRCTICNSDELFQTDEALETHIATVHSQTICKPCKCAFRSTKELQNHYLNSSIHIAYQCTFCTSTELFQSDKDLEKHIANVHSKTFCKPCNRTFRNKDEIEHHLLNSPVHIAYRCTHCDTAELFQTDKDLESHIATFHSDIVCKTCKRAFRNTEEIEHHYLNSPAHIAYRCTHCDSLEIFQTDAAFDNHLKLHLSHHCHTCNRLFYSEHDLTRHYFNSENHPSCGFECVVGLADDGDLEKHLDSCHERCIQCGKYFVDSRKLLEHSLAAHKHVTCVTCLSAFDDKICLLKHILWTHVVLGNGFIESLSELEEPMGLPSDTRLHVEMSTQTQITSSDNMEQSATRPEREMVEKEMQTMLTPPEEYGMLEGSRFPVEENFALQGQEPSTTGDSSKQSGSRPGRQEDGERAESSVDEQGRSIDKGGSTPEKPSPSTSPSEPATSDVDKTKGSGKASTQRPLPPTTSGAGTKQSSTHSEQNPEPPVPSSDCVQAVNGATDSPETNTSNPLSQPTTSGINSDPSEGHSHQQTGGDSESASASGNGQTDDKTNDSAGGKPPVTPTKSLHDPKMTAHSHQNYDSENSQATSNTQIPTTPSPEPASGEHANQTKRQTTDEGKQDTSREASSSESSSPSNNNADEEREEDQGSSEKRAGRIRTNSPNVLESIQGGSSARGDENATSKSQADVGSIPAAGVTEPRKNAAVPPTDSIVSPSNAKDSAPHEGTINPPASEGFKNTDEGESGKGDNSLETLRPRVDVRNEDEFQAEQRTEREKDVLLDTTTHSTFPKPRLAVDIPTPDLWPSNMTTAVTAAGSRATLPSISSSTLADMLAWFADMSDRLNGLGSGGDTVSADNSFLANTPSQTIESKNGMPANCNSGDVKNPDTEIDTLATGTPTRPEIFSNLGAEQSTKSSGNKDGSFQEETIHSGTNEHYDDEKDYDFITHHDIDLASSEVDIIPKENSGDVHSTPRKQAPETRVIDRIPGGFPDDHVWY